MPCIEDWYRCIRYLQPYWVLGHCGEIRYKKLVKIQFDENTETIYMLFAGREVSIGKNCARGLEYGPRPQAEDRTQDRGHSFSQYRPT